MNVWHMLAVFKSTLLILTAFAIVLVFRIAFMEWSDRFTLPFIRTGHIGEIIFLLALGAIFTIVFTKLLVLEFRVQARPRRQLQRRRTPK